MHNRSTSKTEQRSPQVRLDEGIPNCWADLFKAYRHNRVVVLRFRFCGACAMAAPPDGGAAFRLPNPSHATPWVNPSARFHPVRPPDPIPRPIPRDRFRASDPVSATPSPRCQDAFTQPTLLTHPPHRTHCAEPTAQNPPRTTPLRTPPMGEHTVNCSPFGRFFCEPRHETQ